MQYGNSIPIQLAWHVCRARKLTDEQRSAIASYFAVYKGQERGVAKLALGLDDHPALARAYALLKGAFEDVSRCLVNSGPSGGNAPSLG